MASEGTFCNLCAQSHQNIKADSYCPECEEFLCIDCSRHHGISKTSKHHSSISLKDYEKLPLFVRSVKGHCEEHQRQYDMFCRDHYCQLCVICLYSHSNCTSVIPINEIIKDVKETSVIADTEQSLLDLKEYVKKIEKEAILHEVKVSRQKINDHLDSLEKNLVKQITIAIQKHLKRVENLLNDLDSKEKQINNISSDLQKTKECASEFQTFMAMGYIEESVTTEERYLQTLNDGTCLDYVNIELETDKAMEYVNALKNFGDIREKSVPCAISMSKTKEKQAQIGSITRGIHNITLEMYDYIKTKSEQEAKACLILSDKSVVIFEYHHCVSNSDSVNVYQNDFVRCLQSISSNNYDINDAVMLPHNTFAATSNVYHPFLFVVDYLNDKIVQKVAVARYKNHCGITLLNNRLFFCEQGTGIMSYDLDTKVTDTILSNSKLECSSYLDSFNQYLYYTYQDRVAVCDLEGHPVWEFRDTQILRKPRGIAVDKDGYVYVVGEETENVVVISPSGSEGRQLLCRTNGIERPRAMKYDSKRHCLLVCNEKNVAFLYKIK